MLRYDDEYDEYNGTIIKCRNRSVIVITSAYIVMQTVQQSKEDELSNSLHLQAKTTASQTAMPTKSLGVQVGKGIVTTREDKR